MHGNVAEWCWDWYGEYPSGAQTDPKGPSSGTARVRRGGNIYFNASSMRSADRLKWPVPSTEPMFWGGGAVGFRLVRNGN